MSGHISDFEKLVSVVESLLTQLSFLQIELSYMRDDKYVRNVTFIRCKACIANNTKRCIHCHQGVSGKNYTNLETNIRVNTMDRETDKYS